MDKNEIESKVKNFFERSAKVSKTAFEKAGDKVQNFTDKSIAKIDIKKLQLQQSDKYKELGILFSKMLENGAEIHCENQDEKESLLKIQDEIKKLSLEIQQKQEEI